MTAAQPHESSGQPRRAAPPRESGRAVPCLTYDDVPAALHWLSEVLGADARTVHADGHGTVVHAEVWFGDACVMLGARRPDGPLPDGAGRSTVYLVLDAREDVDARHARAAAHGARIAMPLHETAYGSRDFACLDREGNAWCFGTYDPAMPAREA